MALTLGSLFSGLGGFELSGMLAGIEPKWLSEIEPFPLRVTAARFPNTKPLGSVTDIDGAAVEPVDIVTFGSPCQDLSVAGKQKGIHEGQRSNLFFEAIRIIKQPRQILLIIFFKFLGVLFAFVFLCITIYSWGGEKSHQWSCE